MKIALFIPCYVNAAFPQVGIATYKLLSALGCEVDYPLNQTCCGQPMANAGFEKKAVRLAMDFDKRFAGYDYVVAPSGSCTAFVKFDHPRLLKDKKKSHPCLTAGKVYDVCEFIHDILKPTSLPGEFPHIVSLHHSCHTVRQLKLTAASELNIPYYSKIKDLLLLMKNITVVEPQRADECCGFGGMFAVEEQAVSVCMGEDKVRAHIATGAEYIAYSDSSCQMHQQGIAERRLWPIRMIHVVEILSAGL